MFSQTPKAIEADLYKSFRKIDYWFEKERDTTFDITISSDSLSKANEVFGGKLKYYTSKYPFIIKQSFPLLRKYFLNISTSRDGLFRIYSWDTRTGGTMHYFENVFQYKTGLNSYSALDTPKTEGDNRPNYHDLYTLIVNGNTYYLATYLFIGSTKDMREGIQVFAIEDGKLNDDVKLIKTKTGLHSQLEYDYDFFSIVDWKVRPEISFDQQTKTIHLPLVTADGKVTHSYIDYKFTGKYFERVKN